MRQSKSTFIFIFLILFTLSIPLFSSEVTYSWYQGTDNKTFCGKFKDTKLVSGEKSRIAKKNCREAEPSVNKWYENAKGKIKCGEFTEKGWFIQDASFEVCSDTLGIKYRFFKDKKGATKCGVFTPESKFIMTISKVMCEEWLEIEVK